MLSCGKATGKAVEDGTRGATEGAGASAEFSLLIKSAVTRSNKALEIRLFESPGSEFIGAGGSEGLTGAGRGVEASAKAAGE